MKIHMNSEFHMNLNKYFTGKKIYEPTGLEDQFEKTLI